MIDDKDLEALRNAHPSFLAVPNRFSNGLATKGSRMGPFGHSEPGFSNSHYQAPFPTPQGGTTAVATEENSNANRYSFELELDSVDAKAYTVDIHIGYGEINNDPPVGMTEEDDYVVTLAGAASGTEFWAVITYDPDSLEITSRSINWGPSVPDTNTIGTLYVGLGFVDFDYGPGGKIIAVYPRNRQCGDINLVFTYGALNAEPAICAPPYMDWVAV